MKKLLEFYYNIHASKIYKNKNDYYFFIKENKHYIKEYKRDISIIDSLVKISNSLYNYGILVNTFIINKNKKFITEFNKKNYVILRVNDYENNEIDLKDIIKFASVLQEENDSLKINIINSWKNRIDKLEEKILEFNKEFQLIQKSVNYYIGLAENAISYAVNSLEIKEKSKLVLCHNRFINGLNTLDFNNPLTFVIDYIPRDISMYIKIKFFNNINVIDELESLLKTYNLNEFECRILFARLLYPDYYFDAIDRIIYNDEDDRKLEKIINQSEKYEHFLFNIYILLKKYVNMPEIEWLIN